MTLDAYVRVLRRYWYVLLIGLVAGALVGGAAATLQPKTYTADSSGFVTTPSSNSSSGLGVGSAVAGDSYAKSRVKSYADLGKSRAVASEVIEKLGLQTTPDQLVSKVTVTVPQNTVTIKVSAQASTAQGASDLANAWIASMGTQINRLESGQGIDASSNGEDVPADATPAASLTPMESAVVPSSPSSPNLKMYLGIGAVVGLLAGVVFAIVRSQYDRRIRSSDDVKRAVDTPIVGMLPFEDALVNSDSRLSPDQVAAADSRVSASTRQLNESLRELRTNISFLDVDNPPRSIVVTSALPGDGKSTVAANLAAVFAETGGTVVLIDGDLRKPTVATSFGLNGELGLTDVLAGRTTLDVAMHRWSPDKGLFVLPAGSVPPNPSELLASDVFQDLVKSFTAEGATVVIDSPPLLPVTDAAVLTARNDGALVVVAAGQTRADSLATALERIKSVNGSALGVVLNRVPTKGMDKGSYGYYHGDYYKADDGDEEQQDSNTSHRSGRRRSSSSGRRANSTTQQEMTSVDEVVDESTSAPQTVTAVSDRSRPPLLGDDFR